MAITYKVLATTTVGSGGIGSIDFTSISADYTDLQIFMSARGNQTTNNYEPLYVRFNNDTTNANYRHWFAYATGTSVSQTTYNDGRAAWMNSSRLAGNYFANIYIYIPAYSGSQTKTFFGESAIEGNQAETMLGLYTSRWTGTDAINRITLVPVAGNFLEYTTATLYGIKNTV